MTTLAIAIGQWDGKSSDELHQLYNQYREKSNLAAELIDLLDDTGLQIGATWLLKALLSKKHPLTPSEQQRLFQQLTKLGHWQSKLHILQSLAYLTVDSQSKPSVEVFVRHSLTDTNKFVRAWAYDGFYQLARQYGEYSDECQQLLTMAMRDEPASVQARVRAIVKQGFS